MKYPRVEKPDTSGNGRNIYNDPEFYVSHMVYDNQKITVLRFRERPEHEAYFDGWIDLSSGEKCFEQLEYDEFLMLLRKSETVGFELGASAKQREIRKALGIL